MIIKIGNIELTEEEAERLYTAGKVYLITYRKIYILEYSKNAGYHGRVLYIRSTNCEPFTKKGRFYAYTAAQTNHLIGFNLFNE